MSKQNQKQDETTEKTPLTAAEEAELKKLEEEEAKAAAEAAVAAARVEAARINPPPPPQSTGAVPPRVVEAAKALEDKTGVPVICLKDNPSVFMGGRMYSLRKGQTVYMDPSHATELAQSGWVVVAPPRPAPQE